VRLLARPYIGHRRLAGGERVVTKLLSGVTDCFQGWMPPLHAPQGLLYPVAELYIISVSYLPFFGSFFGKKERDSNGKGTGKLSFPVTSLLSLQGGGWG